MQHKVQQNSRKHGNTDSLHAVTGPVQLDGGVLLHTIGLSKHGLDSRLTHQGSISFE
jgi:hypothetical protein